MGSFQLRGPDYLIKCQTEKKTVRAYILFCWHQLINILSDHVAFFVPLHDPLPHLQDKYHSPRYHILTQHHLKTEKHKGHTIFAHFFFVEKENLSRNLFFFLLQFFLFIPLTRIASHVHAGYKWSWEGMDPWDALCNWVWRGKARCQIST